MKYIYGILRVLSVLLVTAETLLPLTMLLVFSPRTGISVAWSSVRIAWNWVRYGQPTVRPSLFRVGIALSL